MTVVALFPGTTAEDLDNSLGVETEDLDAVCERQRQLLDRWGWFGQELTRRSERPLPFDLALELHDLIDET